MVDIFHVGFPLGNSQIWVFEESAAAFALYPGKDRMRLFKTLLRQFGLKAKKRLGQHFLVDEGVLGCILSAAELNQKDIVVEVGPGLGMLTKRLAEMAGKVIAVELDSKLASTLAKKLASFPNVSIIHGDILKISPLQLLEDYLV